MDIHGDGCSHIHFHIPFGNYWLDFPIVKLSLATTKHFWSRVLPDKPKPPPVDDEDEGSTRGREAGRDHLELPMFPALNSPPRFLPFVPSSEWVSEFLHHPLRPGFLTLFPCSPRFCFQPSSFPLPLRFSNPQWLWNFSLTLLAFSCRAPHVSRWSRRGTVNWKLINRCMLGGAGVRVKVRDPLEVRNWHRPSPSPSLWYLHSTNMLNRD